MGSISHQAAAARLSALDIATLDAMAVQSALELARQLEGWLASVKVAGVRRLEELRRAGEAGRAETTTGRLWGKTAARQIQRRSDVLTSAPAIHDALAKGRITAAHVDAVGAAAAATPAVLDHQADLAHTAATTSPDEFSVVCKRMAMLLADDGGIDQLERQRRDSRVKRWVDRFTGMYHLTAQLDPERGAATWAALDAEIERHFHAGAHPDLDNDQRAAAAVHALVTGAGSNGRIGATVHVHVDLDTLTSGLRRHSTVELTGGGALPVDTIRRMACDAEIIPYVLDGHGAVVDVGRARRLATRRQRHALRAMYPTCAIDGCSVSYEHTRIHHLRPFEAGGRTDLANLLPLCDRHHHDAHEGGWLLSVDPTTRTLTVTAPDGTVTHTALRRRAS